MRWNTKSRVIFGGFIGLALFLVHQFSYRYIWNLAYYHHQNIDQAFRTFFPYVQALTLITSKLLSPLSTIHGLLPIIIFFLALVFPFVLIGMIFGFLAGKNTFLNRTVAVLAIGFISYHLIIYAVLIHHEKSAAPNKDSGKEYCDETLDQGAKNSCYYALALKKNDPSYCMYMPSGNYQLLCRAEVTKDPALCEQADNSGREPYTTKDCLMMLNKYQTSGKVYNGTPYRLDENHAYCYGKVMDGADPKSFEVFDSYKFGNGYYAKDKNNVYYEQETIPGADPISFKILSVYATDKNFVYFKGKKIEGSDGPSFKLRDKQCCIGSDKNYEHAYGCIYKNNQKVRCVQ